jgi:hypothetical protein
VAFNIEFHVAGYVLNFMDAGVKLAAYKYCHAEDAIAFRGLGFRTFKSLGEAIRSRTSIGPSTLPVLRITKLLAKIDGEAIGSQSTASVAELLVFSLS